MAAEHGVQGIVLSNHGVRVVMVPDSVVNKLTLSRVICQGRQLDG